MIDKRDALHTLAPGDRVNWPEGCDAVWGTVVKAAPATVQGVNGPVVAEVEVVLDVEHWPTVTSYGWPTTKLCTVTRRFLHRSDVYDANTP